MEATTEKEDAPSTRLRQHQTLSLASDLDLLKCMQHLALKIAGRADETLANLKTLDQDTSTACIRVENCIQNLNLASTKQFVEKRVYDEEVTDKTEEKIPTANGVRTQTDFTPKIKEALSFGLPGVKSMLSGASARPLPYILGSEEFIDCPTAGVVYPQRFQKQVHQEPIQVPTIQASSGHSSPTPIQDAILEKSLSSSDGSSISSATPANSVPPSVPQPSASFIGNNLQEELAARLKLNPEVVTRKPQILIKPNNEEQPAVSIHEPDGVKPPSLPVESKRRNLFDDTSSESGSDSDLFKSAPAIKPPAPTLPTPKEPVFQPELPKAPVITVKTNGASVPVKEKQTKGGLFGSSDSEDDLFATTIPNRSSIKSANPPGNDEVDDIFSNSKQATVIKPTEKKVPPVQTLQINKSKSLFMESDSDDGDLFGPVASLQPKRPESTLSQVTSTSSSQTESPDLNRYQQSTPVKQTVENGRQSNQQATAPKKPAASLLFGDDSEDEDLFSGLPAVKAKSEIVISKPSIPSAVPPVPDSADKNVSLNVTSPPKLEAPKVTSTENTIQSAPNPPSIIKASAPSTAAKEGTKKSILFTDDSDDDDLFKGIAPRALTKQQFPPAAPRLSEPHYPAVPTFHNQITKSEVQELVVPSIESREGFVKAPSSALSPSATTSPTGESTKTTEPSKRNSLTTPTVVSHPGAIEEFPNDPLMEIPLPADSVAGASSPPSVTGRIAALKLSLSQQPSSLPFSTSQPGSTVTSPTDEVGAINQARKPFGGVALFTPTVTNALKSEPTVESTGSTSPTEEFGDNIQARKPFGGVALFTPPVANTLNKTEQTVESTDSTATSPSDGPRVNNQARKPFGGVPLFSPPVPSTTKPEQPVESQPNKSDIDADSLPCLAKGRPKAPAARRLPSRTFRRSQILDDSTESLKIPPSEIEEKDANQVEEKVAPIKKTHKLLDSESSDDELFKPVVSVKGVPTKLPLTNEVKAASKQPESKPITHSIDTSDDELFKPIVKKLSEPNQMVASTTQPEPADATTKTAGGIKSNVKINTTLPLESDSDDGLFNSSSQLPVVLPRKTLAVSSLLVDSDSDDDLFSSVPKRRDPPKTLPASSGTSQITSATIKDPLLGFHE